LKGACVMPLPCHPCMCVCACAFPHRCVRVCVRVRVCVCRANPAARATTRRPTCSAWEWCVPSNRTLHHTSIRPTSQGLLTPPLRSRRPGLPALTCSMCLCVCARASVPPLHPLCAHVPPPLCEPGPAGDGPPALRHHDGEGQGAHGPAHAAGGDVGRSRLDGVLEA
jgi:hypothetical protein